MSIDIHSILAIDPPRCGCLECAVGEYIPLDSPYIDEVLQGVIEGVIDPANNQNGGTMIIGQCHNDSYDTTINGTMVNRSDYIVIPENSNLYWDDAKDINAVYEMEESEEKNALIRDIANEIVDVKNPTDSSFIAFISPYNEPGLIELYNVRGESVRILWYYD